MDVIAVVYLAASYVLDVGMGELDAIAIALLATSLVFAVTGSRRVEVGPGGIHVFRRRRLRLSRPLERFAFLKPGLFGLQGITFDDGKRVWIAAVGPEATRVVDYLGSIRAARGPVPATASKLSDVVELPVAAIRFPPGACVGCSRPATKTAELEASTGLDLIVVGFAVTRTLIAPACRACKTRRILLPFAAYAAPILAVLYCIFGPQLAPEGENDPLKLACLAFAVLSALGLMRWGARVFDRYVFGISVVSLSKDTTRVRLRVRDTGLRSELDRLSREAALEGGAADASGIGIGV